MKRLGWVLTPWAFCLGCSLFDNGVRTLVVEPVQYCSYADQHRTRNHNEKLAREAWGQFCACEQGQAFSEDYACGFVDGFADYLDAGGCGEPPPLPPRRYWDKHCEEGRRDWFAGFRSGTCMAQKSGLRECIVVPTETHVYHGEVLVYPTLPCPQEKIVPVEVIPPPIPSAGPATNGSPSPSPSAGSDSSHGLGPATNGSPVPSPPNSPLPNAGADSSHGPGPATNGSPAPLPPNSPLSNAKPASLVDPGPVTNGSPAPSLLNSPLSNAGLASFDGPAPATNGPPAPLPPNSPLPNARAASFRGPGPVPGGPIAP